MRSTLFTLCKALVATALGLGLCAAAQAQAAKKPNILVIWGDDIGQFNISAYNRGHDGLQDAQHRPHRQAKARCSPTGTASRAAPPAAPPSSPASRRSAPA